VLDPDVVVADRAAGWLHGLPVLRRGSHLKAPPIEVCHRTDTRSTHGVADGHRRMLANRDIETLHGLRVTTLPRTCLDLGRLTWRYDAIAALDSGLRAGLSRQSLRDDARRFRGFRGVRQLRALLEIADGASESPGESALRLHWHEAGLPAPESQIWLTMGEQRIYRLDLGSRRARFAAEFDGEKFHTETEDRTYDEKRRARIESEFGWMIEVFTREIYRDLVGTQERLRRGYAQALRRDARWSA